MVAWVFSTAPNSDASLSLIFFLMFEDRGQGVGPKTEMLGSAARNLLLKAQLPNAMCRQLSLFDAQPATQSSK